MARKTKFKYKTRYMPSASNVITREMQTGRFVKEESPYTSKELYNLLYPNKYRRFKEWKLIGGYISNDS